MRCVGTQLPIGEEMDRRKHYVAGADFGSDSVRVVVMDAADGTQLGSSVSYYPRWKRGLYCDSTKNQFRQHPKDYTESLAEAMVGALSQAKESDPEAGRKLVAFSIDTTGSTPALTDASGHVLAERPEFSDDPDAMFILWKDHTAVKEADRINELSRTWGGVDYTKYSGGVYSAEWFWSKLLHVLQQNEAVRDAAVSAVEHCDWIVGILTGTLALDAIKRSRCAAGHKCLWHAQWNGYPSSEFLDLLDPKLSTIKDTLGTKTYTTDVVAGSMTDEWKRTFGIESDVLVTVGAYDAHIGAVGGDVGEGVMVKSIGTSTCDVIISDETKEPVPGICGQVDGSVVPGYTGYEAGQSSYGDLYAWFRRIIMWPLEQEPDLDKEWLEKFEKSVLRKLEEAAESIPTTVDSPVALDWINGRRTPIANQNLTCAISGLRLGTSAPQLMKTLLEATAFGARAIIECFVDGGVGIDKIIAIGGVARKSRLGMQILADVTGREISVTAGDQSPAIGAAIFAATAAGLYPDIFAAQKALSAGIERIHTPDSQRKAVYDVLYQKYLRLGAFVEKETDSDA